MREKLEKLSQNIKGKEKAVREIMLDMKVRDQKANMKIMILRRKPY